MHPSASRAFPKGPRHLASGPCRPLLRVDSDLLPRNSTRMIHITKPRPMQRAHQPDHTKARRPERIEKSWLNTPPKKSSLGIAPCEAEAVSNMSRPCQRSVSRGGPLL